MEEMILIASLITIVVFFLLRPFVVRARQAQATRKTAKSTPVFVFHRPDSGFELSEQHPATIEL